MNKVNPELFTDEMISFIINNQEHDFQDEWFLLESNGELYDINLVGDTFTESGNSEIVVYEVYEEDDTLETNVNNFYKITKNDIEKWRLENV
jgi:hypothetical protein